MGKKILHVDDSWEWLQRVKEFLEANGHSVISVLLLNGAQHMFQKGHYDIVICDGNIQHPEDGLEWADKLYELGQKVIILASDNRNPAIPFNEKGHWPEARPELLKLVNEI